VHDNSEFKQIKDNGQTETKTLSDVAARVDDFISTRKCKLS